MLRVFLLFLATLAFGLPVAWLAEVAGVPFFFVAAVVFVVPNYLFLRYNARVADRVVPIPARGYERRREEIERDEHAVFNLGFARIDEFCQKTTSDYIAYSYKHHTEPVFLCLYHFGVKRGCDFVTYFADDVTLTTASTRVGGYTPRPPDWLLQIHTDASYEEMFTRHRRAVAFLRGRGHTTVDHPAASFRGLLLRALREYYEQPGASFLFLKLAYGFLTGRAAKFCAPLEEQRLPPELRASRPT